MQSLSLVIAVCALGAPPGEDVIQDFAEHTYHFSGGAYQNEPFKYRLLEPASLVPGKKYPLVLFLHGAGERGDDNVKQLQYLPELMVTPEYREKFPCFLIAPQCRETKWWVSRGPEKSGVSEQMQVVEGILREVEQKYPVDLTRVYLTGLSMGGFASWNLAARHPDWFAAVVPICGGGDPESADKLAKLPIWAFHGSEDKVVPPKLSQQMIDAVRDAGGHPKYTELAGVGHDSWTPAYSDPQGVLAWLFEQRNDKAQPASP